MSLKKRSIFRTSNAFSLIQLMIALGLGAAVLGGAFLLIRSFSGNFNTSQLMEDLQREMEDIRQIIDTDLELAVRITGQARNDAGIFQLPALSGGVLYTRNHARDEIQGIMPLPKSAISDDRQGLIILRQVPGVNGIHFEIRGTEGLFSLLGAESALNGVLPQVGDTTYPLFLATSGFNSELIQIASMSAGRRTVVVDSNSLIQSFGTNSPHPTSLLELIVYERYDDQSSGENLLVRRRYLKVNGSGTPQLFSEKIIAKNVISFEPLFSFHEQRSDGSLLTPPQNPIAHLSEDACVGGLCVNSTDLSKVFLKFSLKSFETVSSDSIELSDSYQVSEDGHVIFLSDRASLPASFNTNLGVVGGAAVSTCNISNIYARCNPECRSVFTNPRPWADSNHPWNGRPLDWEGYGDLNSDYCKCAKVPGTSPSEYEPPEQHQGRPGGTQLQWSNTNHQAQIKACVQAISACNSNASTSWLQRLHPGAMLACHCLQPRIETSPYYDLDDNSPANGILELNLPSASDMTKIVDGTSAQNHLFCHQFQMCDSAYQQFYNKPADETPWIDSCRCKTRNLNLTRNGTTGATHGLARDFAALCGLGGSTGQYDCADPDGPLDDNGNYVLGRLQSLSPTEQAHCECLKAASYDPSNYNRFGRSTINGMSAGMGAQVLTDNRSFLFSDAGSPSFTVNRSDNGQAVTHYTASLNVTVDGTNFVCAQNYCSQSALAHPGGLNAGCRMARHPSVTNDQWQQIIDNVSIPSALSGMNADDARQSIAGFCTRPANSGDSAIDIPTRELLTGTGRGATLPSWCVGPSANAGF